MVDVVLDFKNEKITVDGDTFDMWDVDREGNKLFLLPGTSFRPVYYIVKRSDGRLILHSENIIKATGERKVFDQEISQEYAAKLMRQVFGG